MSTVQPLTARGIAAHTAPPGVRPREAAAPARGDSVDLRGAEAPAAETSLGTWQRAGLAAMGALALAGGLGAIAPAAAHAAQPSQSRTVEQGQNIPILRNLSERGMLFSQDEPGEPDSFGKPLDAASAKRSLERGEAVVVRNPRIGNYEKFYTMAPPTQRDLDRNFQAEGDVVRSYEDLGRLNHAERLTNLDTRNAYSPEQREVLRLLQDFEGGIPTPSVNHQSGYMPGFYYYDMWGNYIWTNPGYYESWQVRPNEAGPSLVSAQDRGGFLGIGSKADRLSSYEALQDLESGAGIRVRTGRGIEHEVRSVQELRDLHELEGPRR